VSPVKESPLPAEAFLQSYLRDGHHTDCYSTDISGSVSRSQFVAAFYTTFLFRIERLILKLAVSKPSTDAEALRLGEDNIDSFAAWRVEARNADQLLLCDFLGRTRSWLMVERLAQGNTRLYFGSAVVRTSANKRKKEPPRFGFSALLWFHHWYSIALLRSARKRLEKAGQAPHR
jgi:hypothetical protein